MDTRHHVATEGASENVEAIDLAFFVEQSCWIIQYLPEPTIGGLISWLTRHLSDEIADTLRTLLVLEHPDRKRAEQELIALLKRSLHRPSPRWFRSVVPRREVDWTRTYVESFGQTPSEIWCRRRIETADHDLQAALVAIANSWSNTLLRSPELDHRSRGERLASIANAPELRRLRPVAYSRVHESRLRRIQPEAAQAIREVSLLPYRILRLEPGDTMSAMIARLGQHIVGAGMEREVNLNALLEVSVQLAILRGALTCPASRLPDGEPWAFATRPGHGSPRSRYVTAQLESRLNNGDYLVCQLSKGPPDGRAHRAVDHTWSMRKRAGIADPRRLEPDIWLAFWLESAPEFRVHALGDAKRNSDKRYIRPSIEKALVYLVAYSRELGMTFADDPSGSRKLVGRISPAFTLFFRRYPGPIPSADEAVDEALHRLDSIGQSASDPDDAVLSLFMRPHFEPGTTRRTEVLAAWLGALARQALKELGHE